MWNVFKKVWVKAKGVKAVLSDACNIGHVDEGDVTNGERTLFPQRFPWRSSLRMRGSSVNNSLFMRDVQNQKKRHHFSWILVSSTRMTWTWLSAIAGKTVSFIREARNTKHDGWRGVADSDIPSPSVSSYRPLLSETGRSMIEMLGVLAIIGVLSIAAVTGYRWALVTYRANETIEEVRARAIDISAQLEHITDVEWGTSLKTAYPLKTALGYPAEAAIMARNGDYFKIQLSEVPYDLCRQIARMYESENILFINETRYINDLTLCQTADDNILAFIFANDLSNYTECGAKAEFDADTLSCHCSGKAYINMDTNACECPIGHIWSEDEHDCIETICQEGYFESLDNGCIPCTETATYDIAVDDRQRALCRACRNEAGEQIRDVVEAGAGFVSCVNTEKNNCVPKESFRRSGGSCVPCDSKNGYVIGRDETSIKLCTDCGRQTAWGYYNSFYCVLPTMCDQGSEFIFDNAARTGLLQCVSCDTMTGFETFLARGTLFQEYCNACQNEAGDHNRTYVSGNYPRCVKSKCDSGEFLGANGHCYLCTDTTKRQVNAGSGCTDSACGREEVTGSDGKTYCQLVCDTSSGAFVEIDGNCYPCDGTTDFKATKAQCDLCQTPKRLWVGNYGNEETGGTCMEACTLKTHSIGYTGNNYSCYSCGGYHEGFTPGGGHTDVSRAYCEACGNYVVTPSDGNTPLCMTPDSCTKGSEFRRRNTTNYKFCVSCDLVDPVEIGDTQGHRDMCRSCNTTRRFFAGDYCYPCTTLEAPAVTTDDEVASCKSCLNRLVEDGACILPQ